ncbi:hypothetical protein RJT34_32325 [Clitoria ternatea]|uniref:Uncharacterized protein n=1 Tax=Clitoria ternatea TaxID=43366 RepID=A0AAN9I5T5_CLITE
MFAPLFKSCTEGSDKGGEKISFDWIDYNHIVSASMEVVGCPDKQIERMAINGSKRHGGIVVKDNEKGAWVSTVASSGAS